jgi:hypothetical protein
MKSIVAVVVGVLLSIVSSAAELSGVVVWPTDSDDLRIGLSVERSIDGVVFGSEIVGQRLNSERDLIAGSFDVGLRKNVLVLFVGIAIESTSASSSMLIPVTENVSYIYTGFEMDFDVGQSIFSVGLRSSVFGFDRQPLMYLSFGRLW